MRAILRMAMRGNMSGGSASVKPASPPHGLPYGCEAQVESAKSATEARAYAGLGGAVSAGADRLRGACRAHRAQLLLDLHRRVRPGGRHGRLFPGGDPAGPDE